ncbi:MAG TPA: hypothetical protein VK625_01000 [Flavitalea sp.]|nr:hypothetical protein [Flavitalea sp.]
MPLNLPYYTSSTGYEKIQGEVEVNGKHYNYVKRKISHDTLYILCITNSEKNRLSESHRDYAKLVTDAPGNENEKKESVKKLTFGLEYNQPAAFCSIAVVSCFLNKQGGNYYPYLSRTNIDENFRPPGSRAS